MLMGSVAVTLRLHILKTDSEKQAFVIRRLAEKARKAGESGTCGPRSQRFEAAQVDAVRPRTQEMTMSTLGQLRQRTTVPGARHDQSMFSWRPPPELMR
jgi:hypothetical protein